MKGSTCAAAAAAAMVAGVVNAIPASDTKLNMRGDTADASSVMNGTQVAVFWGQSTEDLSDVCADGSFDIIIMSFVTSLIPPKLNLGKNSGSASTAQAAQAGWDLFDATLPGANGQSVAEQIQGCQSAGKKVFISFGGTSTVSNATFSSADEATQAAEYLWQLFLGGTNMTDLRPFGSDVILDGVDLDNESGDGSYYDELVAALRGYFDGASQSYYLSADPVCGAVADGNATSIPESIMPYIDFMNIQFYNNDQQEVGSSGFEDNVKQWDSLLSTFSPSPKLIVGIPGGVGAAMAGPDILTASNVTTVVSGIKDLDLANFGGMMVWDAGYAMSNTGFPAALKGAL